MSENIRQKAGVIYNVVETVILAVSVGLLTWTAQNVINQGRVLSAHETLIHAANGRLDILEGRGSRSLEAHVKDDDARVLELKARVDKVEAAVVELRTMPGKLEAIGVRLDALKDGQGRIEKVMDEQLKKP